VDHRAQGSELAGAIFDLGGVVFRYAPERRLEAFARLTGRPPDVIRKALMDSGYSTSCDTGRLAGDAVYREGIRLIGRRLGFDTFRSLWMSAFEPDAEVVELVRALRERLPVAMLTNNSDLVRNGLDERFPEVMELFRPRLFSADAGLLKPDPRLYRTLLDLLGLPAQRVLYVDDDPACAAAAASLGMVASRFHSATVLERELRVRELIQ
jgi:putative hydrolase of the HAD superfamily